MTRWRWRPLGRVFVAEGQRPWMASHTATPVAWPLGGTLVRVFFGTRDPANAPRIGFVDIDLRDPQRVLRISEEPALDRGALGHFDENGVYPSCLVPAPEGLRLYYTGRMNGEAGRYTTAIGLALAEPSCERFTRSSRAPVLDRGLHDPWCVLSPWVRQEPHEWRAWYGSGLEISADGQTSLYHIKYARSTDGLAWERDGRVAVALLGNETNVAKPTVLCTAKAYHMWLCAYAEGRYRIGYAESPDGLSWRRDDSGSGFQCSGTEWDNTDQCYPFAFIADGNPYLLYCGNAYGRGGIGISIAE